MSSNTVYRINDRTSHHNLARLNEPLPSVRDHEVLVEIRGVTLNARDIQICGGFYPAAAVKDDLVPCSDGAGVISAVGDSVDDLHVGDRVIINISFDNLYGPLKSQKYMLGGGVDGTLRQYAVVPAQAIIKVPVDCELNYVQLASLVCTGATVWNALYGYVPMKPGQTVLFQGTGGVSITGVQLAKAAGAVTIVTSSSDDKLKFVKEKFGVDHVINYKTKPNWAEEVRRFTNGEGADYVIEIGGAGTIEQSIKATASGGMIAVIGYLADIKQEEMPNVPLLALIQGCALRGVQAGSKQLTTEMINFVSRKNVHPYIHKTFGFTQDEVVAAFDLQNSGNQIGKVGIAVQDQEPLKMDSPSFSFTTPEQRRQRFPEDTNDANSEDWHFRNGPSPIVAPRFQGEEQDESKENYPDNFATSHFRRRNRLESRLEELQKDVASLTLKLRANGNRSTSLDASSFLYAPKEKVENKSYPVNKEISRKSVKDQGQNSTVKIKRELHHVTTERDQLKFELERTRKALIVAEKKCQEAAKSRKAYEKLKAHCDSLQESLDLSEKIRVRQKKLLQQLQQQQRAGKREKEVKTEKKRPVSAGVRSTEKRAATNSKSMQQETSARGYSPTGYDILNSLVTSHQLSEEEEEDADRETHEQAPSEPTAAVSRSRTPRSVLKPTAPTQKQYRSDFDSLLQVDAPQFSTRRPSRIATNTTRRRPSQTQVQQRDAMRQAAKWARTRGAAVDISTSTTQLPGRRTPTAGRPKNSFLAPTQASLRRLHDLPRRGDLERRPFVV